MATGSGNFSGSFNGKYPQYATPYIIWSYSQSIENNQTTIYADLKVKREKTGSSTSKSITPYSITIAGETWSGNVNFNITSVSAGGYITIRSVSKTITHNSDGTLGNISLSGNINLSGTTLGTGTVSGSVSVATIPRASQPSASNGTIGSSITINTNRVSSSFTHNLYYSFGNATGTIATGVGTSTTWTPALSLCSQIPNTTSGICTITCQTYSGNTLIGSKSINITLSVPSSVVPTINSVTLSEGNSTMISKNWGVYVQNKSQLHVVTSASGLYGSTITNYRITGIDSTTYSSSNFTSNTLTGSGTKTITITVTDSRGRTASTTKSYTCVAYSSPTITSGSALRCNSNGTTNEEGNYVKYTFKSTVSSVSTKNSHIYKVGYKSTSSTSYTYITLSDDTYSLNKENIVISGVTFNVDNSYDIQLYVQDAFTTTTKSLSIPTGFTLMNWNASGKAMAIGKVSEAGSDEKLFELGMQSKMSKSTGETFYKAKRTDTDREIYFGVGSGGTNRGIWDVYLNKWIFYTDDSEVYLKGISDKVKTTAENPSSTTNYNIPFSTNSNKVNDGLIYRTQQGTSSAQGYSILKLGNTTSGGTAGNKEGWLRLCSYQNGALTIKAESANYDWACTVPAMDASTFTIKKSLYSNTSGSSGTVVLSASAAYYNYLEIYYKNDDGQYGCSKVYSPNGKTIYGTIIRKSSNDSSIMLNSALYAISGTTITPSRNSQANIYLGGSSASDTNKLYITQVIAYK